jgi:hypothetical protein
MNKLELELLVLLDFEVAVCHRAYHRYRDHLEKEMLRDGGAKPQAKPNGVPAMPPTASRELLAADF